MLATVVAAVALAVGATAGIVSRVSYPVGISAHALAVGDFNEDGKLDLAVANGTRYGTVSVLLGRADASFAAGEAFSVGKNPFSLAATSAVTASRTWRLPMTPWRALFRR